MSESELEALFYEQICEAGLPLPEREKTFIPGRKFRADFMWRKARVIVEVMGGTYAHMAHSTGKGIERDYEKANLASAAGWRYFQFSRKMIKDGTAIALLKKYFYGG